MPSDVIDMSHNTHAACKHITMYARNDLLLFFFSVKQKMSSTTKNKWEENTSEIQNHKNQKFTIIFYFVWQSTACVFARIVCSMYPMLNDLWLDQVLTATSIRVNQKICAPETHVNLQTRQPVRSRQSTRNMYKLNKINMDFFLYVIKSQQ